MCFSRQVFHDCVLETPICSCNKEMPHLPRGHFCLALQGIGAAEVDAFSLLLEEDGMLRQLAGSAFGAHVCLVFLIGALLFS